jgi:hypothetical protein
VASEKVKKLSVGSAFFGGVTGLAIAWVLYGFATAVSASFDNKPAGLPLPPPT